MPEQQPVESPTKPHSPKRVLSIRPKTYYIELAELGALYDFVNHNMANEFQNDIQFRNNILSILIDNSNVIVPEVEAILLGDLSTSLHEFLNTVNTCQTQP